MHAYKIIGFALALMLTNACGGHGGASGTGSGAATGSTTTYHGVVKTFDLSSKSRDYYLQYPLPDGAPCDVGPADITFSDASSKALAVAHPTRGKASQSGTDCKASFTVKLPDLSLYRVEYNGASPTTLDGATKKSGDVIYVEAGTEDGTTWSATAKFQSSAS